MPKIALFFAVLVLPATVALAAEKVFIDNLVATIGPTIWRAPHVEISDPSLTQADLAQLFSGAPPAIDERLAKFSASRAVIPSMTSETRGGSEIERSAFGASTLENIVAGRVALWRSFGGHSTVESKDGKSNYVWGPMTWKGADLRQMTRLAFPAPGASAEPLKPVLDEEVVEHMRMVDETEKLDVTTSRLALSGVKARPLSFTFSAFVEKLEKFDPEKSDPTLIKDILEVLNAFEIAGLEARDLAINGKGGPGGKPYSAKVGRLGAERVAGAGAG
ncbi:MAG: hypothetical protein N2444_08600, partial [Methylocystis sp.]|nr:hypothetical protein [Methylocystis sp.]